MPTDIQTRLEEVETTCAHQRRELDSLNETISEQWHKIDELSQALLRLHEQIKQLEATGTSPTDPPPPHY